MCVQVCDGRSSTGRARCTGALTIAHVLDLVDLSAVGCRFGAVYFTVMGPSCCVIRILPVCPLYFVACVIPHGRALSAYCYLSNRK